VVKGVFGDFEKQEGLVWGETVFTAHLTAETAEGVEVFGEGARGHGREENFKAIRALVR
jgi:hypothetical protein